MTDKPSPQTTTADQSAYIAEIERRRDAGDLDTALPATQQAPAQRADTRRNSVIGLAELHEGIASRSSSADELDFHTNTAATLRALVNERDYPDGI